MNVCNDIENMVQRAKVFEHFLLQCILARVAAAAVDVDIDIAAVVFAVADEVTRVVVVAVVADTSRVVDGFII